MKNILFLFLCLPFFSFAQNKIELRKDEKIIKEGKASFQAKLFNQPGRAYITNQRFYFVPSKLTNKRKVLSFEINEIKSVNKGGASFKGGLAAAMNTIKMTLNNEKKYIFIVNRRKKWIEEMTPLLE